MQPSMAKGALHCQGAHIPHVMKALMQHVHACAAEAAFEQLLVAILYAAKLLSFAIMCGGVVNANAMPPQCQESNTGSTDKAGPALHACMPHACITETFANAICSLQPAHNASVKADAYLWKWCLGE